MSKASAAKKPLAKSSAKPKIAPKAAAKPAAKRAVAPVKAPAAKAAVQKPQAAKPIVTPKPAAAPKVAVKTPEPAPVVTRRADFKVNDHVVYPAHGVGQIVRIEEQEVAGHKLELFVITFEKDKMTLRVPTPKAKAIGMRKLAGADTVLSAMQTLRGRARIKRTMWSRRAQEYEAKINSGDLISIAEVVRDLHRAGGQPEQSYSERQLYEAALDRLSREIAAVQHVTETEAIKEIEAALSKGPRRGGKADADAVADGESDDDEVDGDDSVAEDEAA